jgi:hypothetical protein
MEGFEIIGPSFVVTGNDDEEIEKAAAATRQQIAFYGSTPAYRGVLEIHGWGGLQDELNALSKQGEWEKMGTLIDDEILNTFAVVGEPEAIAPELSKRYGDVIQRSASTPPTPATPTAGRRSWPPSAPPDDCSRGQTPAAISVGVGDGVGAAAQRPPKT